MTSVLVDGYSENPLANWIQTSIVVGKQKVKRKASFPLSPLFQECISKLGTVAAKIN